MLASPFIGGASGYAINRRTWCKDYPPGSLDWLDDKQDPR